MASVVQSKAVSTTSSADTCQVVFDSDATSGNLIVVMAWQWSVTAFTASNFSDSLGNTYTAYNNSLVYNTIRIGCFYAPVDSTGACTITMDPTTNQWMGMVAWELSGVETSSPFDASSANNSSGTDISTGDCVTSQDTILLAVMTTTGATSRTLTPDSGWTQDEEGEDGSSYTPYNAIHNDSVPASSGTYNAGWTLGFSEYWQAAIVAVKASAGDPPTDPHTLPAPIVLNFVQPSLQLSQEDYVLDTIQLVFDVGEILDLAKTLPEVVFTLSPQSVTVGYSGSVQENTFPVVQMRLNAAQAVPGVHLETLNLQFTPQDFDTIGVELGAVRILLKPLVDDQNLHTNIKGRKSEQEKLVRRGRGLLRKSYARAAEDLINEIVTEVEAPDYEKDS